VALSSPELPWRLDARRASWPAVLRCVADRTSQVASGALLGMALRADLGLGPPPEELLAMQLAARGYVELTAEVIAAFGRTVHCSTARADGDLGLRIGERRAPSAASYDVPADPSAAVYPLVLAAVHGVPWEAPANAGAQPEGRGAQRALAQMRAAARGAVVELAVAACPDAFPALCVAAAARPGETRLGGAPALRLKESDRIAAMAAGLRAAGIDCVEQPTGLAVRGPWRPPRRDVRLPAPADHRVVMALAMLGAVPDASPVVVPHAAAVAKSWPDYFAWLGRVARVTAWAADSGADRA
jgi:3-phosphoshikimate 1-carboxyvinyltransferase